MSSRRLRRLIVVAAAIVVLVAAARTALAAYPPVPPRPPRARCRISTIVDRRIAIICNAGRSRARKRAAIQIGTRIVVRGVVGRNGLYVARFTLRTRLTRGTRIRFLVEGKVVAALRA
jgi:hypothetical protein